MVGSQENEAPSISLGAEGLLGQSRGPPAREDVVVSNCSTWTIDACPSWIQRAERAGWRGRAHWGVAVAPR